VQKLQSTEVLSSKFFERLSLVELSDPKCTDAIGTKKRSDGRLRTTYLKLSTIDLEALRLALHNPETRLCIGEVPAAVHTRIQGIRYRDRQHYISISMQDYRLALSSAVLQDMGFPWPCLSDSLHSHMGALIHALFSGRRIGLLYHPSASAMRRR
jgi:hypothetical protein